MCFIFLGEFYNLLPLFSRPPRIGAKTFKHRQEGIFFSDKVVVGTQVGTKHDGIKWWKQKPVCTIFTK